MYCVRMGKKAAACMAKSRFYLISQEDTGHAALCNRMRLAGCRYDGAAATAKGSNADRGTGCAARKPQSWCGVLGGC